MNPSAVIKDVYEILDGEEYDFSFELNNQNIDEELEKLEIHKIFNKEFIKFLLKEQPTSNKFRLTITKENVISISQGYKIVFKK